MTTIPTRLLLRRFAVDATHPVAVPTARRAAHAIATEWGVDGERLDALLLITSEAVTNAHLHAPGRVLVVLTWSPDDARLAVEVHDTGRRMGEGQASRFADDRATVGRGLALLVEHLTRGRWEVVPTVYGKRLRAELAAAAPPARPTGTSTVSPAAEPRGLFAAI
ncbi:ATP-binding protein [Kitasatospora sp. NPDC093679]|uniref:ATP-binding protein n=1 Tax=Kitasatospora sp. NPDC093679 TaxID=3154983 RepID=UPI0034407B20